MTPAHGLVLAAGEGRRMGRPKALLRGDDDVPFVTRTVDVLRDGGCGSVTVVVGAAADQVSELVAAPTTVVVAEDWADGMGASLRAGLAAVPAGADCVVVSLVDLPDVGADVVRRVLEQGRGHRSLRRASYDGVPGHPVVLGRDHWPGVLATATGDRGAREYLRRHPPELVECGDLATGRDVDTPDGL